MILSLFEYIGLLVSICALLKLVYKLINNIGTFYYGLGAIDFKSFGSWAVVTGGTDGIGLSYAKQLASNGLNLVLISNQQSEFDRVANSLANKYSVKVRFIFADFTEPISIYSDIESKLAGLDIGVLVNNVGMLSQPQLFQTYFKSDKHVNDVINCNIISLTKMTSMILPRMLVKGRGVIINVCSASGRTPTLMESVYSSTKAYMDFFSRCLMAEYASKGIIIQSVCPFFVSTKLLPLEESLTVPKPDDFVQSAIKTIGSQPITNGSLIHNIMGWFCENLIPTFVYNKLAMHSFNRINKRT